MKIKLGLILYFFVANSAYAEGFYQYECKTLDSGPGRNVRLEMKQADIDLGRASMSMMVRKKDESWKKILDSVPVRVKLKWSRRMIVAAKVHLDGSGTINIENLGSYNDEGKAPSRMHFQITGAKDHSVLDGVCKWMSFGPKPSVSGSN